MREVNYDERWKVARDLACKINLWPTVENLRHLDAALRRAKAEGMREAGKIARANAELLRPPSRQFELNMVNKAKSEEAGMIADEIDARAAQIEEGE